ncbi:uncharacterized protein LOC143363374 [Halictus rubicundus]|uniref:uncharacterized protein LOC143363374 n=1 Tax=Halictus rubicundus TaxID=77578 RepID=UPI00403525DD
MSGINPNIMEHHLPMENLAIPQDPPPSYEVAIDIAPPPSSDSLFDRIRHAHKTFGHHTNIVISLLYTITLIILFGVLTIITVVIPICMVVIGGLYINECPQGVYIPIYLLVNGSLSIFKRLCCCIRRAVGEDKCLLNAIETLTDSFTCILFVMGTVWVYQVYSMGVNYDPAQGKYCNRTLYLFAFWLTTVTVITAVILYVHTRRNTVNIQIRT